MIQKNGKLIKKKLFINFDCYNYNNIKIIYLKDFANILTYIRHV